MATIPGTLLVSCIVVLTFWGCSTSNRALPVVPSVDLEKYSGQWYEIMRLPHGFESGLKCVTATYSLKPNGDINVLNSGHKIYEPSQVKTATGTAWIPDASEPAKLKVRFFWPFSGNYWIIALDPNYRHVMIGDPSREYLWILCREKMLPDSTLQLLLSQATAQGFDVSKLERVSQDCN